MQVVAHVEHLSWWAPEAFTCSNEGNGRRLGRRQRGGGHHAVEKIQKTNRAEFRPLLVFLTVCEYPDSNALGTQANQRGNDIIVGTPSGFVMAKVRLEQGVQRIVRWRGAAQEREKAGEPGTSLLLKRAVPARYLANSWSSRRNHSVMSDRSSRPTSTLVSAAHASTPAPAGSHVIHQCAVEIEQDSRGEQ